MKVPGGCECEKFKVDQKMSLDGAQPESPPTRRVGIGDDSIHVYIIVAKVSNSLFGVSTIQPFGEEVLQVL
jgi:hypothetical protein